MNTSEPAVPAPALRVAHCFQPRRRRLAQQAVNEGRIERLLSWDALLPERMYALARLSLYLFLGGVAFFLGLNLLVYRLETGKTSGALSWGLLLLVAGTNIVAYLLVLALHEGLHGLVFALLGGRPVFGARLPFALYCGAPNQLFTRNAYIVVGLAPLALISLAGIALIVLAPGLAPYVQLGLIGNFSGSAGDVWAVRVLLRQPPTRLVQDTETGFEVYTVQRGV